MPHDRLTTTVQHLVALDGSGSADADSDTVVPATSVSHTQVVSLCLQVYDWDCGGGVVATGATPTVSLPAGTHNCVLTVTDTYSASSTDTVSSELRAGPGE